MPGEDSLSELQDKGFCVLRSHFAKALLDACRKAFWPILLEYIRHNPPNRGPHRHFLPVPFEPPCFAPEFFFDAEVLSIVSRAMDERVVADQWGCDAPVKGSINQEAHIDYKRPLFPESPDLVLPTYMLVVSFGLVDITIARGPIEIALGTHRMQISEAVQALEIGQANWQSVILGPGDVLIRHPWALHRGTPNITDTPRALLTIRFVRRWYSDNSREVHSIPQHVWQSLTPERRAMLRFPVSDC